ncbi:hypothetical protein BsWGS_01749 [Bradybaena similaris]
MIVLIIVIHVAYILQTSLVHGVYNFTSCTYNSDCTASTNFGLLDLNVAATDKPYEATVAKPKTTYYWKPCQDFALAGVTAGSIQQAAGSYSVDIGIHNQASCDVIVTSGNGNIRFNMMSKDDTKFTHVTCSCGTGNKLKFTNEKPANEFNFLFTSKVCCPNSSPPPSDHVTATISPGTVVLIVFFSSFIAYFILGTVFQVAVRKAEGRERIPNVSMWAALPSLVLSGFIFTFTRGRRSGYGKI